MSKRIAISESIKKQVAGRQRFKCANKPGKKLNGVGDYECPLWKHEDGTFDQTGYCIDHIIEYAITQNNDIKNLQALCSMCHQMKTKIFQNNNKITENKVLNNKLNRLLNNTFNSERN